MYRYDSNVTTFSPEGRLYQVEYAMQVISRSKTGLGILAKDGIVLASERATISTLVEQDSIQKICILNDQIICLVFGMMADGQILVNYARQVILRHQLSNGAGISCEQLVRRVCEMKQAYTQHGGLRPFAASITFAGWDPETQFGIYKTGVTGDYLRWKAVSSGQSGNAAQTFLEKNYASDISLEDACTLAVQTLNEISGSRGLTSRQSMSNFAFIQLAEFKIQFELTIVVDEVVVATLGGNADGEICHHFWSDNEVDSLLRENGISNYSDQIEEG